MSEFQIVFQNDDWVAVDKPAGWLTVPSRFEKEDARKVLGRELERQFKTQIYPVHRLDLEVSGLVLFATSAKAQRFGNGWFEGRNVSKTYQGQSGARDFSHWPENLAKASEEIPVDQLVEWKCRLLRGKRRSYESPRGDRSVTLARLLKSGTAEILKWELQPLTGRSHQLRFEMSRHGYPLLGDELYGSKQKWSPGIALRAVHLDLIKVPAADRMGLPAQLNVKELFQ